MKRISGRTICIVAVAAVLAMGAWVHVGAQAGKPAAGHDWPAYRGPNGNGISNETGWSSNWSSPPKELWKADVGKGYSSVAVAGGKLYTMGNADDKNDIVWCFDAKTGKEIWKKTYACGSAKQNPGPRATPTVDGGLVFTVSRQGHIICWDAASGEKKWEKNAGKDFGCKPGSWGFSGSVVIDGDDAIVDLGKIVALKKTTGETAWESQKAYKAGYSTVTLFEMDGKKCLAAFPADGLVVLERGTGKEISFYPWKTNYDVNSVTPLYADGKLFISSDYGVGCALAEAATGKELWKNKNMCNHYTTCILVDGFLYGIDGAAGPKGVLKCMDLKDGSVKWSHPGLGTGSLMMADKKLIVQGASGDLVVAEANPKEYKQLAAAKPLSGECWTMPVLSNGVIYCRNTEGNLVALDVSGK